MKNEKSTKTESVLSKELEDYGQIRRCSILHRHHFGDCLECLHLFVCMHDEQMEKIDKYAREDQVEALIIMRYRIDLRESITQQGLKAAIDTRLKFEIEAMQRDYQARQKRIKSRPAETVLPQDGPVKIVTDGSVKEICLNMKNFVDAVKNSKGGQLFRTDNVTLANWICFTFKPIDGSELNFNTVVNYLAKKG